MSAALALDVRNLRKKYDATVALDGVSLRAATGEVHALLGENGAGKSTFVKVLSGLVRPDEGAVAVEGRDMPLGQTLAARACGIRTAFQEMTLVRDLTVAQNFLLGEEPTGPFGLVRARAAERRVAADLDRVGLSSIDPRAIAGTLDLPTRQKIEIARAVSRDPKVLLLDEPTASLSAQDVLWLGDLVDRLKARGTCILFISHRMQEVRDFCDTITILRNGRTIETVAVDAVSDEQVIEATIGRSLTSAYPTRHAAPIRAEAPAALAVGRLASAPALVDVSFELAAGRILGIGGLDGMGQRDLFLALFGVAELTGGEIRLDGKRTRIASPRDAIRAGIGLVPEDRKTEGLFPELSGGENASLPSLGHFSRFGIVGASRQQAAARAAFSAVQLATRALWSPVRMLSGGNQQKIVLAKWLLTGSRILLLYDPTRGVDVGTKAEIYALMHRFVEESGTILFYSTEIAELVNMCDEVLVLYRGRVAERLAGDDITETAIMRSALGGSANAGGQHGRAHQE